MSIRRHSRSGAALVLVVLSVLGTMSVLATREFAIARRTLAIRQNRIQAEWLARSGADLAVARLLADEDYTGGTVEPIATGPVEIKVERDWTGKTGDYHIRCDATIPSAIIASSTSP